MRHTWKNWKDYYGDKKYHASMFVRYSADESKPKGFISTYVDDTHIYRGTSLSEPKEFGQIQNVIVDDFKDYTDAFDQTQTLYLLNDGDGNSLNSEYFKKDSFFTTGGSSLGVLWLRHTGNLWNSDYLSAEREKSGYMKWFAKPQFDIALSRKAMKNNPDDESYLDIGTDRGDKDYFLYVGIAKSGNEKEEPYLYMTNVQNSDSEYYNHWHLIPYDYSKGGATTESTFWLLQGSMRYQYYNERGYYVDGNDEGCLIGRNGWMVPGDLRSLRRSIREALCGMCVGKIEEGRWIMIILNELDSMNGISDEDMTRLFKESIRLDDEVRKIKGLPVARYEKETKRAYLEYPDGRREYVGKDV